MKRIKFVRQVKVFCELQNRRDYIKEFEPLIEKLPTKKLDEKVLKKEFNKFCQNEHGFSLEESKELYSKIMSARLKSYGLQSSNTHYKYTIPEGIKKFNFWAGSDYFKVIDFEIY